MTSLFRRIGDFLTVQDEVPSRATVSGFMDSLIQTFENCRPGLTDEMIQGGEEAVERYFLQLYEKELSRLSQTIRVQEGYLSAVAREKFLQEVCDLIKRVVIPAYVRFVLRYTPRERNNFYLIPEPFHFLERAGWCIAGIVAGGFVVWAPFIPLWSKEWVVPFLIAGLFYPNLRRFLSIKRYESELNRMVAKTDREIQRIEMSYLTGEQILAEPASSGEEIRQPGKEHEFKELESLEADSSGNRREDRKRIKH